MSNVIEPGVIGNITGNGIPKPEDNQNTDDIVPARFLKEITFAQMGEFAYIDERFQNGQSVADHPFNDSRYEGGSILIAGANYGCGSSREHAPQALMRYGIRAIIAPSFAEIFAGNCASLGIVGVTASQEDVSRLVDSAKQYPGFKMDLDIGAMDVLYEKGMMAKGEFKVDMPEGRRQAFLNGTWDAMSVLQADQKGVDRTLKSLEYLSFK